jgi:preprotein translocase subunit YajC
LLSTPDEDLVNNLGALLPLLALAALFWFLVLRPAQRRQRDQAALVSRLEPGLEVMTTSGMYGTVRTLDDDVAVLEVAPGVTMRFAKQAIMRIVTPPQPAETSSDASENATADGVEADNAPGTSPST